MIDFRLLLMMKRLSMKLVIMLFINIMLLTLSTNVYSKAKQRQLTPITLQLMWKHQFEFAGFYAAIDQGYYQAVGLDVKTREYSHELDLVNEVVTGKAQYGISDSSLVIDRSKGAPVVLLTNIFQHSPMVLLTLAESKIYSPAQIVGKRIMLSSHEKNNASIIAMLNSESVSLDQADVIEQTFNLDDLVNGQVDIISAYATNEPGELIHNQVKFNIIDPINYGIDFYGNNIFTSEKELREHPDRVDDFVKASLKGWQYALDHPSEMIDLILSKYSTRKSREALVFEAKTLERFILPEHIPLGTIDVYRMERIVDTYKQLKMLPASIDLDEFIYQPSKPESSTITLSDEQRTWIKQHPKLILGVDPAWAPFEFFDQNGNYSGMGADYIKLITNKTGLNFIIQHSPTWKAVMDNARSGQLDLMAAVMKTQLRSEFLDFSSPYIKYPMVIVTAKDVSLISSLEELQHKQVAVVKDYVTEELLRSNHPGIKLVAVKNLEQALKLVSSGEVDALVDNLASVSYTIHQLGIGNLRISGTTPYEFALSVAIQKQQKILLEIIQKALDDISDEEHQQIRNKWVSVKYTREIDYSNIIKISVGVLLFILLILIWNWRLAREVKARKIVEDALRDSEVQFRNLVENTSVVAWELVIETFQFTYVSPHAEAMFGYPVAKWKEKDFWVNHVVEDDLQTTLDYIVAETKKGRDHVCEYRMKKADGEAIWLRDIVTVNQDENGIPVTMSGVFIDIDESKKYEEILENARLTAERANNVKSEFLATMSHELRTPMNGVLGMAQLLQQSELTTEQHQDVDIIIRSGTALVAIINDVLDFSKLEAEQITLDSQSFNLEQLGHDILDMFIAQGLQKNIKINQLYPKTIPRYFVGDSLRLQQILINLVGNAVKFTSEGSVQLIVSCQSIENQQAQLTLSVEDTGVGIAADKFEYLFEPFRQADQSTTRQFGGTGLGLAISKKLIRLMGGDIGINSDLGKGSKFWIRLSLPLANEQDIREEQLSISLEQRKLKGKILLVEDDKVNQKVALGILRKLGLEVDLAEDGQQGYALWKNGEYDLILMDCRMPVMDGYEATEAIRADEKNTSIPIFALTANSSPEDKMRCLESGMNDVITKPFKTEYLLKVLNQWLESGSQSKTTIEQSDDFAVKNLENRAITTEKPLDLAILEKYRVEMGEDYSEILYVILQEFDAFFIKYSNDLIKVSCQELARSAHNLKSRGATLGAGKLGNLAADIEKSADKQELIGMSEKIQLLKSEYILVKTALKKVEI